MSNTSFNETESRIELFIKNIVFKTEPFYPYMLPGFFLSISLLAIVVVLSIAFLGVIQGRSVTDIAEQTTNYSRFIVLFIGYVLLSSILSYRYCSLVIKHLIDSGITAYYWLRVTGDYDSIKTLYYMGLMRRNIPSPTTLFILTLVTGGLAYPFILYVLEKNLRNHCIGEEKKFLNKKITGEIDVANLLIDIVLTIVSLGLYMIYLSSRLVRVYNKHIKTIHNNHPHRPVVSNTVVSIDYSTVFTKSPLFLTGLVFLTTSVASIFHLLNTSIYFIVPIVHGLYIVSISVIYSKTSFTKQIMYTFTSIYLSFALASIIGLTGFTIYRGLLEYLTTLTRGLGNDPFQQLSFIYINNLVISLLSLIPYLGSIYIGSGLSNAGLIYGVVLGQRVFTRSDYTLLQLFILPHTVLELLSYSLFISLSTRLFRIDNISFIKKLVLCLTTLFIAAIVEVLTIQLIQ